ncbi:hypothetical protein DM860_008437 [Cuscuta australis]|uniref:Subtilisin-like protease SBT1.7 n=1 Tax=Cuscuta australis TaxID=267555 RepID=A0A328D8Y5_9ASTE|nr:hypothetical protein DM860_008437 [Cuscuta australis]
MLGITVMIILAVIMLSHLCHFSSAAAAEKKTFIVQMAKSEMPSGFRHHTHWYNSALKSVSESGEIIYAYDTATHGFSAQLTAEEALFLENLPGVLSVRRETIYQLHTTRTPLFLGLTGYYSSIWPGSADESNVVIGVIDSGVWPEIQSFDDGELGPIPSSWKGACETGTQFNESNCNRKLIGARYFSRGIEALVGPINESTTFKSPRDDDGHGTHTASTAGGGQVPSASLFGYAPGTARGMAKNARIAMYKACWKIGCVGSDILAAMEKAIDDGVNILSLSLGGGPDDYYNDVIAIGAFAAVEKGIFVSCSAGNSGPTPFTATNLAPWITTVGAGTLDRDFPAPLRLGNGNKFPGVSLFDKTPMFRDKLLPIVYAGNASNSSDGNLCLKRSLVPEKVKGKIVLCDRGSNGRAEKGIVVKEAGGAGMVLANDAAHGDELVADAHLIPATHVTEKSGRAVKAYVFSSPNPTAGISFKGTKVGIKPSPVVAGFSSRGPNLITPQILKPDLIAPGVHILAGWSGANPPNNLPQDTRRVKFNIISGTSMSCPHASGIAALLKAARPGWSPAAIRSALMTTAYRTYWSGDRLIDIATGKPSTPYDHGSGHVNPIPAIDPGLVYDIKTDDYLNFLCASNYTRSQINTVARRNFTCDPTRTYSVTDLNYPSFAVVFSGGKSSINYTRTLINVGESGTYEVYVSSPNGVEILVEPQTLSFTEVGETQSYMVTFTATTMAASGSNVFGEIEWSDGMHVVGSPVAITWS